MQFLPFSMPFFCVSFLKVFPLGSGFRSRRENECKSKRICIHSSAQHWMQNRWNTGQMGWRFLDLGFSPIRIRNLNPGSECICAVIIFFIFSIARNQPKNIPIFKIKYYFPNRPSLKKLNIAYLYLSFLKQFHEGICLSLLGRTWPKKIVSWKHDNSELRVLNSV